MVYTTQFINLAGQITNLSDLDKMEHYINRLKPATQQQLCITCPQILNEAITQTTNFDTMLFEYNTGKRNNQEESSRNSDNKKMTHSR